MRMHLALKKGTSEQDLDELFNSRSLPVPPRGGKVDGTELLECGKAHPPLANGAAVRWATSCLALKAWLLWKADKTKRVSN